MVSSSRVVQRSRIDASGNRVPFGKWLPKFKPPREEGRSFNCLELAGYGTEWEAEVVRQMAAFYYGKDERRVGLEDGFWFDIPLMPEEDVHRRGEDKRKWVTNRVKEVFNSFKRTHDQWRELQRIAPDGVEVPAEQGVDDVNDLSDDHTLPQCPLDSRAPVFDFLISENQQSLDAQDRQGEPNAQLSLIPDNVESDAIGNHPQPLADVLTPAFERTVDDLISRGTREDK